MDKKQLHIFEHMEHHFRIYKYVNDLSEVINSSYLSEVFSQPKYKFVNRRIFTTKSDRALAHCSLFWQFYFLAVVFYKTIQCHEPSDAIIHCCDMFLGTF